jgi:HEAT repeat protein
MTADVFLKYLEKEDPQVVAAAASGLAAIDARQAVPALDQLLAGISKDARFSKSAGRPGPDEFIEEIRTAAAALRKR